MAVTASQQAAFNGATLGVPMSDFQLTILLILFSVLYTWMAWLMVTQWRAWAYGNISFYDLLWRCVRAVLVTLLASFLLI